ncbi:unnamed protein product, partial [Symbiodinium pilosum]
MLIVFCLSALASNKWLDERRTRQEGEEYTDAVGRLTEAVNRRAPQLRHIERRQYGFRVRPNYGEATNYVTSHFNRTDWHPAEGFASAAEVAASGAEAVAAATEAAAAGGALATAGEIALG